MIRYKTELIVRHRDDPERRIIVYHFEKMSWFDINIRAVHPDYTPQCTFRGYFENVPA